MKIIRLSVLLVALSSWGLLTGAMPETYPSTNARLRIKRNTPRPVRHGLELVPLFVSCSYYFPSPLRSQVKVEFRAAGEQNWQLGLPPVWIAGERQYRGSLVNLRENTLYEVRIADDSGVLATKKMQTWGAPLRIARTVVLNADNFKGQLTISAQGRPDGWIRYTSAPGFVLRNEHAQALIRVVKARYVILEKLTLQGGGHNALEVINSHHIRIINCDISNWGSVGKQRFDLDGKYYFAQPRSNGTYRCINYSSGISLFRGSNLVVERCYIHDPRNHANSWIYSHPAGPCAVYVDGPTATVIRYNDFVGSDVHRWNDAVEGQYNFYEDGGFNRDADIYGNFFIYCNDDNIELDGGQQNVRCFRNRFESSFCGVSIQGNMAGPSYIFDNIFLPMCDEFGHTGQFIKTWTAGSGLGAQSFIFNNSFYGRNSDISLVKLLKVNALNNIFCGSKILQYPRLKITGGVVDYNITSGVATPEKHGSSLNPQYVNAPRGVLTLAANSPVRGRGTEIPNFTGQAPVDPGAFHRRSLQELPERPIPVTLNAGRLDFKVNSSANFVPPHRVIMSVGGKNFQQKFQVVVNRAVQDWLKISPRQGTVRSGDRLILTVRVVPEKMRDRAWYRGAFLVRFDNGLSRPVSVYGHTDYQAPARLSGSEATAIYLDLAQPHGEAALPVFADMLADGNSAVKMRRRALPYIYHFEVPRTGRYWIMLRARQGGAHRVQMAVDDAKLATAALSLQKNWSYNILAPGGGWHNKVKCFNLTQGKHILKLNPVTQLFGDLVVITDDPKAFEPR